MKGLFFHYLPYGVIDALLTLIIITQVLTDRFDLLWASVPLLIFGIISLNRKLKQESHDLDA